MDSMTAVMENSVNNSVNTHPNNAFTNYDNTFIPSPKHPILAVAENTNINTNVFGIIIQKNN